MTLPAKDKKFDPGFALVDKDGRPTQLFRDYMAMVDRLLAAVVAGNAPTMVNIGASGTLAANDAAAAAAGVPVGAFYRDAAGIVHVRTA